MESCGELPERRRSGARVHSLNIALPKISLLNPQYLIKKQGVFQKIAAFVEKFKGVGGQV
jgi:hypothetical protein